MILTGNPTTPKSSPPTNQSIGKPSCYHCGDECQDNSITIEEKSFCCNGCEQVYKLLNENNLCNYYNLDSTPGIKAKGTFVSDRFAYLDEESMVNKLTQFNSGTRVNVVFQLPQIHCSSCIFLLENLHRINEGIITSQSNFQKKEVFISYNPKSITLRQVVELLSFVGYEPAISLQDANDKKPVTHNRQQIYKIGVAGFCFSNIMMLSFPEYFSGGNVGVEGLKETFTWIILGLSLPVLFYSASGFFSSAWKGLRQNYINIDAPIALAILVTFGRSYFEIFDGSGAGYLDSATGIVFFMLIGRWFQNKTYDSFSFDRDYRSYFPLGVTVLQDGSEKNIPVTQLQIGNRILLRNEEMVPADSILINGNASIDYSFVSGENAPVTKAKGELIFAGGKQCGSAIMLEIIKEPSQSYITQLWNNDTFHNKKNAEKSFIHPWSRYFTFALFMVAISTLIFWWINDTSKILPAVSSVLIVACPCSLLLAATFTYGNMLRIYGKNKLYLKNAGVIESMAKVDTIVFDKTGTLTQTHESQVSYEGTPLTQAESDVIRSVAHQSSHPLSKIIGASIGNQNDTPMVLENFKEYSGRGLEATVDGMEIKMGSSEFVNQFAKRKITYDNGTHVHIMRNNVHLGRFKISNQYRKGLSEVVKSLQHMNFSLNLLSGDNDSEKKNLERLFGQNTSVLFNQSPQQKLDFIQSLQQQQKNVLMLGDGLNDAGALMQSNVGIAVSDNTARFSPACDAILDSEKVQKLHKFLAYAKSGKSIVTIIFIISIIYNILGLSFAVQAKLSPMVAAILMPVSSITIVSLATLLSSYSARMKDL